MKKSFGKTFSVFAVVLLIFACNNATKKKQQNDVESKGVYEAVFIDINDTLISDNVDKNVKIERRLLKNLNLTEKTDFWGDKTKFYMHTMGSITIPESQYYHFRLTSSGGIVFKINNKEVIANRKIHPKEINTSKAYIENGHAIFEVEYYCGSDNPYIVLEWSKDEEHYEMIPEKLFNNLDAFNLEDWIATNEDSLPQTTDNTLSKEEQKEGWKLLFDGKTMNGWHTYNKPGSIGRKWKAENGILVFEGRKRFEFYVAGRLIEMGHVDKVKDGGEDIVSDESYENFELNLEWMISEAGNNGIFYTVQENEKFNENWHTSPEMQVMDNQKHKDGLIHKHRAGDLYDLIASEPNRTRPQGQWNQVRIIKNKGKVEQWLNGTKVVSFDLNSAEWKDMISKSKFAHLTNFASSGPGKIGFQDHDNMVHYKNIKLKILK